MGLLTMLTRKILSNVCFLQDDRKGTSFTGWNCSNPELTIYGFRISAEDPDGIGSDGYGWCNAFKGFGSVDEYYTEAWGFCTRSCHLANSASGGGCSPYMLVDIDQFGVHSLFNCLHNV